MVVVVVVVVNIIIAVAVAAIFRLLPKVIVLISDVRFYSGSNGIKMFYYSKFSFFASVEMLNDNFV